MIIKKWKDTKLSLYTRRALTNGKFLKMLSIYIPFTNKKHGILFSNGNIKIELF